MFKFDFDLEGDQTQLPDSSTQVIDSHKPDVIDAGTPPLVASTVEELIENLPPLISYSPLRIPLHHDRSITLIRRDLFDARFQLISESLTPEASKDLAFIDAPSDLVPGVYEGGLKTWECSSDLVAYLDETDGPITAGTQRIIEIGCGTAVPSLYLLHKLFSTDPAGNLDEAGSRIIFHLQDYNLMVLQLVTLPNIILTWYASPASVPYRSSESPTLPAADISEPGELQLTPELLSAFAESLRERRIDLTFFSGSWADLEARIYRTETPYDLVLTSETIYRSASLPSLISLLRCACTLRGKDKDDALPPSSGLAHLSLSSSTQELVSRLCLVAAKVIYFGVGGGIDEFEQSVKEAGGHPSTVLEKNAGVGRRIMKVDWS